MNDLIYNSAELWHAYYYDTSNSSVKDDDTLKELGNFIVQELNKQKNKICNIINESLSEKDFFNIENGKCFADGDIIYDEKNKYIKFPNFIHPKIEHFKIRISINPCVGDGSKQTKIYCMPRYHKNITEEESLNFFSHSALMTRTTIKTLSPIYTEAFNAFVRRNGHSLEPIDIEKEEPSQIIWRVIGYNNKDATKFIELSNKPVRWSDFCALNPTAKKIIGSLQKIVKSINGKGELTLSDLNWFKRKIIASPKTNIQETISASYLGWYKKGNNVHFIGITNCYPEIILHDLNIDIININ